LPSLYEVLDQLGFITRELAIVGLFVTGGLMVLVPDWRASLLVLLGQYLLAGLVLSRLVLPEVALIKVLIGALICPMLYLAARQAGRRQLPTAVQSSVFPGGLAFRLLAVTLVALLSVALSRSYPLPVIPRDVGLGSYWLILNGAVILMLTEEPLKAGQGLLTAIIGFELLYSLLERSLALVWLWAVVNLLLTLAIAYLVVVRNTDSTEGNP
jgi:hypothetical protein